MYLRLVKAQSGKNIRRYAQLVECYRRPDGMPANRLIASLGQLSDLEVANFRAALAASREGAALVVPTARWQTRVLDNLDYLPLALALELWKQWELTQLFDSLLENDSQLVRSSAVLCALTLQRCLAPDSKLAAARWFPRTALPELLDASPAQFHNTRIHRALEDLDGVEEQLQQALVRRYQQQDGAFAVLFGDLTDTWFVGRGPDCASRGRTKNGLRNRHKINILLVCNEHGYPVRWKVLAGNCADPVALTSLVDELAKLPWAKGVPLVFDRAMGHHTGIARMSELGLHFLTAVRSSELDGYDVKLPSDGLAELQGDEDPETHPALREAAAARVAAAGMTRVEDDLYVLDLGVRSRSMRLPAKPTSLPELAELDPQTLEGGLLWLWRARSYQDQLAQKCVANQAALATKLGISRARMSQIMRLLRLAEPLQQAVLRGDYGIPSERTLRSISAQNKAAQVRALTALVGADKVPRKAKVKTDTLNVPLRLVAYFNPHMFVDQRTTALRQDQELRQLVADINLRLARSTRVRKPEAIYAELDQALASHSLRSVYRIRVLKGENQEKPRATLERDEEAWTHRRRHDGFVLLVAHPDVSGSAADIVARYRAKDAVEKDFQTIKSELELRPVFHHTDPKVRAHVSLCMLALLLERTLERKLAEAKLPMTAPACFEALSGVHLNRIATSPDTEPAYVLTQANASQRTIMEKLNAAQLLDEMRVAEAIVPRTDG